MNADRPIWARTGTHIRNRCRRRWRCRRRRGRRGGRNSSCAATGAGGGCRARSRRTSWGCTSARRWRLHDPSAVVKCTSDRPADGFPIYPHYGLQIEANRWTDWTETEWRGIIVVLFCCVLRYLLLMIKRCLNHTDARGGRDPRHDLTVLNFGNDP